MNQRNLIEKIRSEEFHLDYDGGPKPGVENLLSKINRMAEQLSEGLYERSDHFIYELVQNAEDNSYADGVIPELKFLLLDHDPTNTENSHGCLCIYNNEVGFLQENVKAICDFSASTKKGNSGFIGEKGLGFKSVFMVSDSPHIYSNGFQFKFLRNDPVATIGYVVPYWLDEVPEFVQNSEQFTTTILLPLRDDNYSYLKKQLEQYYPETILFLKRLQVFDIVTKDKALRLEARRDENSLVLSTSVDDAKTVRQFWIQSDTFAVPSNINEEKRAGIERSEVSVAFPVDGVTGKERVFAYLPTEEQPGLPFYINADFLLPASRESIVKDNEWNDWLVESVAAVAADGVLGMLNDSILKYNAYQYIPLEKNIIDDSYFWSICGSVIEIIAGEPCVLTEDSQLQLPSNCWFCSENLIELLEGIKPEFFSEEYIIHYRIGEYKSLLSALGVHTVQKKELIEIFQDSDWIENHDDVWLVGVYVYLISYFEKKNPDHLDLKIFRTETGAFASAKNIFQPIELAGSEQLSGVPAAFRGEAQFVGAGLNDKIVLEDRGLDIYGAMGITPFSHTEYIRKTLVPALNQNIESLDIEDWKKAFDYFLNILEKEQGSQLDVVASQIPILLQPSVLVNPSSVKDTEIVTPRNWDKDRGWQNIFQTEEDTGHLSILDDYYTSLRDKGVNKYFSTAVVTGIPDALEETISESESCVRFTPEYQAYIDSVFFKNYSQRSTRAKKLATWLVPENLFSQGALRGVKRESLITWLNAISGFNENKLRHALGSYFYRTKRSKSYDSAFYSALVSEDWVKTTKGYHTPGQVFVKSKSLSIIFGEKLPYLEDELTDNVIDLLGINREATEETMYSYLKSYSENTEVKKSSLVAIYKFLSDYGSESKEQFSTNKFIYLPATESQWFTSQEVIWSDASDAVGDLFGWLSSFYPDSLREFFVNKLEVNEEIDNQSFADTWLRFQGGSNTDSESTEKMLTLALPKINRALSVGDEPWIDSFTENAKVWTRNRSWQSNDYVFVPDDRRLRTLFSEELYFPWLPDNMGHNRMEPIYRALNLRKLSGIAEYSINAKVNDSALADNQYLTKHSFTLLCYAIDNLDRDDTGEFDIRLKNGVIESLLGTREVYLESVVVSVNVEGSVAKIDDLAAFFDFSGRKLYISEAADRDDILDDVANEVARYLWGRHFKSHGDTVRKLLGVSKPERFKKLRENESWHLSTEYRRALKELFEKVEQKSDPEIVDVDFTAVEEPMGESTNEPEERKVPTALTTEQGGSADGSKRQAQSRGGSGTNTTRYGIDRSEPTSSSPGTSAPPVETRARGNSNTRTESNIDVSVPPISAGGTGGGRAGNGRSNLVSGKPRSKNVASNVNRARRSRLRSYVVPELADSVSEENDATDTLNQEHLRELGEKAELIVLEDLKTKGYVAARMAVNNPGYDIEASDPETGEVLYIEVKGDSYGWSDKGVGISKMQYENACSKAGSYYIAIVDSLTSVPSRPLYIQDPISYITEYRFDSGWRELAYPISAVSLQQNYESILEEMLQYTEDANCQGLVRYCDERGFPYPDIGAELMDEEGRVISENIELLWENEKIIVFIEAEDRERSESRPDWMVFIAPEYEQIKGALNSAFSSAS